MGTLIGTPPNAIAAGALANAKTDRFYYWILYGLPFTIVLTFVAWWIFVKIFMKDVEPISLQVAAPDKKSNNDSLPMQRWTVIIILPLLCCSG